MSAPHPGLTGNEHRAAWHAYYLDRAHRRGEQVGAAARKATARSRNPVETVKRGEVAARQAEAAFDAAEPELTYEQFVERQARS